MKDPLATDTPWLFDDFEEGAALGTVDIVIDAGRTALWHDIYGTAGKRDGSLPQGIVTAAMMEAYLRVIAHRPPGNVHAGQNLVFHETAILPGTRLSFDFACSSKSVKRGRRWVTLAMRCRDSARPVAEGEISTIWAK